MGGRGLVGVVFKRNRFISLVLKEDVRTCVCVAVGYERIGAGSFTLAGARPGQKRQAEN